MKPVTNGRDYIPFLEIIEKGSILLNKADVFLKDNKLFIEGRAVSNIEIFDAGISFMLEHYTSKSGAMHIAQLRSFDPGDDNFGYFIEANLHINDIDFLKKFLGAKDASAGLRFRTTVIPFERIWIKTEKKFPYLKVAIEGGLEYNEIYDIEYFRV